jgi:phenylpyruvate tautomerase PptA (4-oxalocrotonate tautomerase family)
MPIVDVEIVGGAVHADGRLAGILAEALGEVFASPPGHTWVRLRELPQACYAENGGADAGEPPVFVTVSQAHPATGEALRDEVLRVTAAVARAVGRPVDRIHVQHAPAGAGRQAFGGRLVE